MEERSQGEGRDKEEMEERRVSRLERVRFQARLIARIITKSVLYQTTYQVVSDVYLGKGSTFGHPFPLPKSHPG